jgi:predicted RNase H-like HicB family nuclease
METSSTPLPTEIELTVLVWKEGSSFVSLCPELGVSSCGESLDEAHEMLREAGELYLANAKELGIWDQVTGSLVTGTRWSTSMKVAV